ncbi:hypothetical protein LCGC14_0579830 [marine sediment metagenome]|uniref:Uncharacterized protein n=1 Tax=marine sediment metagenome TaxID=412755 RepID=A0A0F9U2X6_9ZZZZ
MKNELKDRIKLTDERDYGKSRGKMEISYNELCELLGKPNGDNCIDDKTEVNWYFDFDGKVINVYNWKTGRDYCGFIDCLYPEFMTDWYIDGDSEEKINELVSLLLEYRSGNANLPEVTDEGLAEIVENLKKDAQIYVKVRDMLGI